MKQSNQSGFAVVYGLIILLVASLTGVSLMYMSGKDKVAAVDYIKVRSAAVAARAALQACERQFLEQPTISFNTLNKFISNSSYKWLLGNDANGANTETKVYLNPEDNKSPFFSARIMGFDPQDGLLQIEGIGRGAVGGTKKVIGIYKLGGTECIVTPQHALYLGGSLGNMNGTASIQGDVYVGLGGANGNQAFNQGGTINGNFRVGYHATNVLQVNNSLTVNGKAYIGSKVNFNGPGNLQVNGKSGFEQAFTALNRQLRLNGDAYFNSTYPSVWNSNVNMMNHAVTYNPAINSTKFINATSKISGTNIDIPSKLGIDPNPPEPFSVDLSIIPASAKKNFSGNNISGTTMNSLYASATKWNGYMVLNMTGDVNFSATAGQTFNGKVIWITNNNTITCNGMWYNCSDASNTMVLVNGNGLVLGLGTPSNSNFRGYIHVSSTNSGSTYQFGATNTVFNGAIHHTNGNANFNINSNLNLQYGTRGQSAVQEFINIGLVNQPGGLSDGFQLTDVKIRPILLGINY